MTLDADSPQVTRFLHVWHEAERGRFEHACPNLDYDSYAAKLATTRKKYIALDRCTLGVSKGGVFLIDRETGDAFNIVAYGRPNRRIGTLTSLTAEYETRS